MKSQVLVKRYARGLAQAVGDDNEFRTVHSETEEFTGFMAGHDELKKIVDSPLLNVRQKVRLLGEILDEMGYQEKTRRFLLLLAEHGRLNLLPDVVGILAEVWNDQKGVQTYTVASAVSLSAGQKERLKARLEDIEGGPVSLIYEIDPGLIGGLRLRRGHIVYDASIKGNLQRLQETMREG